MSGPVISLFMGTEHIVIVGAVCPILTALMLWRPRVRFATFPAHVQKVKASALRLSPLMTTQPVSLLGVGTAS